MKGGHLFDHLYEEAFVTEFKIVNYIKQLLHGIKALHDHGIIHLDIKPNNIVCVSRYIYLVFIQARCRNQFFSEQNRICK